MNAQLTSTQMNTRGYFPNGADMYLMQEELARARMRESQRAAEHERRARRLVSARRWGRLAKWAARHAEEAQSGL